MTGGRCKIGRIQEEKQFIRMCKHVCFTASKAGETDLSIDGRTL